MSRIKCSEGFPEAQSHNLPYLSVWAIVSFWNSHPAFNISETKGVKLKAAQRQGYGDGAVGYVELKRNGDICTVKGRVCPEHKVKNPPYDVTVVINEKEGLIKSAKCHGCVAAAGIKELFSFQDMVHYVLYSIGVCKHIVAFVDWIHRKSDCPSRTEVECYWKSAPLAKVGTDLKFITTDDFPKSKDLMNPCVSSKSQDVLDFFLD